MTKLPLINDDHMFEELRCTSCMLPMQYQMKRDDKFLWQCFKCGKRFLVSQNTFNTIEESWSPPR